MLNFDWLKRLLSLIYTPKIVDEKIGTKFWYKGEKIKTVEWSSKSGCGNCIFHEISEDFDCSGLVDCTGAENRVYEKC